MSSDLVDGVVTDGMQMDVDSTIELPTNRDENSSEEMHVEESPLVEDSQAHQNTIITSESKASVSSLGEDSDKALVVKLETEARNDLVAFLKRKGLPESAADKYQVHVTVSRTKPKAKDDQQKSEPSCVTCYVGPDGSMLNSKMDVANDITQSSHKTKDFDGMRQQSHEESAASLAEHATPFTIHGIKVVQLGKVDSRSGFHSSTQIWPVGYRCEQTVEGLTLNGIRKQEITCQIDVTDSGFPQFHIFVPATNATYIGSSEAIVWRKVCLVACC